MPWIEASLRGQRVLARASADGTLAEENGRVEVRYKPTDGKAYRAAARNIEVSVGAKLFPDAMCAVVGLPAEKASGAKVQPHAVPADAWIAYTDGACSGNPGPAGSGVVLIAPGGKMHEGLEYLGEATNNVAELTAILRAVEWALAAHPESRSGYRPLANGKHPGRARSDPADKVKRNR